MCGIIGVSAQKNVSQDIYDGLVVLQHRGQDSAGIMTFDNNMHLKKGNGLVRDVFHTKNMIRLKGKVGIGHVRYPTEGGYGADEAQPFYVNSPYGIALVHNGNLTNCETLREEIQRQNLRFLSTKSDSEVLLNVLADELKNLGKLKLGKDDIFQAMKQVFKRLTGGYAVVAMIANYGMFAFRDPMGVRPLCIGKRVVNGFNEYCFSSEDVALEALGFDIVDDILPGEVAYVDVKNEVYREVCAEKPNHTPCIFEHIYLARPDSMIDGISVYKTRLRMGEKLANRIKTANLDIDVVTPVPDTSRSAALELAQVLGVKYREGLVKNRYVGRTFIMPGQSMRKKSIKYKLHPLRLEIEDKNVLLVDDSIVRGNTSRQIIEMVRNMGAKNVYFASCSPALKFPCVYGVDMPTKKAFVAHQLTTDEIGKSIGADRLFYQELDDLIDCAKRGNSEITEFCTACLSGKYPSKEITSDYLEALELGRGSRADVSSELGEGPDGLLVDEPPVEQQTLL